MSSHRIAIICVVLLIGLLIPASYAQTPLPSPQNLNITTAGQITLTLTWDDIASETEYHVERFNTVPGLWDEIGTTAADVTTFVDTGLTCDTTYSYRVWATDGVDSSDYSNVATNSTLPCPLTNPASLSFTATTLTTVSLQWNDPNFIEENYLIERSPGGGTPWTQIACLSCETAARLARWI